MGTTAPDAGRFPLGATTLPPVAAGDGLDQLIASYAQAEQRLQSEIQIAAMRGSAGTRAYYRGQMLRIQGELARLQRQALPLARQAVGTGYVAGARAVDHGLGEQLPAWAGINRPAMNRLAVALAAPLQRITLTVGRQAADAYRQAGLLEAGVGLATGRGNLKTTAAIVDHLGRQGITGFVDRAGRSWRMASYASMVARTTTREAITQGTVDRMGAHGVDLIQIDEHDGSCEICIPYEGQVYSLSGDTPGYDTADDLPPLHPNCEHVASPADANFEDFMGGLAGGDAPDGGGGPEIAQPDAASGVGITVPESALTRAADEATAAPAATTSPMLNLGRALDGRTATPAQVRAVGQRIADHVTAHPRMADLQRRVDDTIAQRAAARDETDRIFMNWRDYRDRHRAEGLDITRPFDVPEYRASQRRAADLLQQQMTLQRQMAEARRDLLKEAIADARGDGLGMGGQVRAASSSPALTRSMTKQLERHAAPYLPTGWLNRSNERGIVQAIRSKARARAFHRWDGTSLGGRGDSTIQLGSKDTSVALHELSHRMEMVIDDLARQEDLYLAERRPEGQLAKKLSELTGNRAYEPDEIAYPGDPPFADPYMGKVYRNRDGLPVTRGADGLPVNRAGQAGEIFTMAMEGLWYDRYQLWERDPAMIAWVLGILAGL